MNWNRCIIFIVSILCSVGIAKLVMACAEEADPYSDATFFLNTVNGQPAFVPFYYTPSLVFYNDGYSFNDCGINDKVPDQNLILWEEYTGKEVGEADIDSFVYKFDQKDVNSLYNYMAKGERLHVPDKVAENAFTKWFIKHNDTEAVKYLSFAKTCEPYTVPLEAMWDNKTSNYVFPKRDSAAMQVLMFDGLKKFEATKNEDIKLRYAYQIMRMSFYSREYAQTRALFSKFFSGKMNHYLYYRCAALKAGALFRSGYKREAAYIYSIIFDQSDQNRKEIYTSFRWAANGDVEPVLALCRNNHEKAVLYIMQGLYDYPDVDMVKNLQNAYNYDPKVKGLDIVMTRDINKLEGTLLQGIATAKNKQDTQLARLNAFAQMVAANDNKEGDPAYWYLSSAYLYILGGDPVNCKKYLDKANAEQITPNERDVSSIINVLYMMRKDGKITTSTEKELLPVLKDLETKARTGGRYATLFSNMMIAVLGAAYKAQGNTEKALYCYSKAGADGSVASDYRYDYTDDAGGILESMDVKKMQTIEAFVMKGDKSPFDEWLTQNTRFTPGALYELEGTKYIRMFQFDKAAEVLAKVPDSLLKTWKLPDVTVSHILDGQEWNKSDSDVSYTKLDFAKKMLELQQKLKSTPGDARAAYQYANGLYSMSYYGKAHHAYDYYRSGTDEYAYFAYKERSKLTGYETEHYNVQTPEKYYLMAFGTSTDREVKARCLFMAAKCWQKNCAVKGDKGFSYYPDVATYYKNTFKNPHLLKLKNEYKDTKFFNTAVGTCSYLRDYVKKNK